MTFYRYGVPSLIDEIEFVPTEKGGVRAYMHASETADPALLRKTIDNLHASGSQTVPFDKEGKSVLEVRDFGKEKHLLKRLEAEGVIQGAPQMEKGKPLSLWDQFRKRTLQATGVTYLTGDYGFFRYNMKEADALGMVGALSYFLGTLSLIGYGRNDQSDIQVRDMAKDLQYFLTREKVEVPKDCALHTVGNPKKKNLLGSLDEFAKRYPSELFNTFTALAGVFVAASAAKKVRMAPLHYGHDLKALSKHRFEGWMDVGLGTITAISGTLATIVKEKKPDPDTPPTKGFDWIWQQVQAHPLAIAGGGYTIATTCHAVSTVVAYKEAKRTNDMVRLKSVPGRALFVGMAFLSEFLLAISSKGHGEGVTSDESVEKSVYAIAAEMLLKKPPQEREWHLQHIAGFLQQPDILAESYETVEKNLREEVARLQKNPWLCRSPQEMVAVPALAEAPAPAPAQVQAHQPHKAVPTAHVQVSNVQVPEMAAVSI